MPVSKNKKEKSVARQGGRGEEPHRDINATTLFRFKV
jgi:hypothetical protein